MFPQSQSPDWLFYCTELPDGAQSIAVFVPGIDNILLNYDERLEDRNDALRYLTYKQPELAAVDSSAAELRHRIGERGIMHSGATHEVSEGIKLVRRYICDGQGVRLLQIHPRCVNLINEMQSYRYDDKSLHVKAGEPKPKKIDDHCVDALRYMLWSIG